MLDGGGGVGAAGGDLVVDVLGADEEDHAGPGGAGCGDQRLGGGVELEAVGLEGEPHLQVGPDDVEGRGRRVVAGLRVELGQADGALEDDGADQHPARAQHLAS